MSVGRPREFDPEQALEAAMQVFWSKGYLGASVSELLDAMDVQRSTMYASFGDKPTLFLSCFERYLATVGAGVAATLEQPGSPLSAIRKTLEAVADFVTEGVRRGCMITNSAVEMAGGERSLHERVRGAIEAFEGHYAAALRRAVDCGELDRSADIAILAKFLVTTNQGLVVLGKSGASRKELTAVVEVACKGLSAHAAPCVMNA